MKIPEVLRPYISISNSPSAIGFDTVFQPNYPAEAWQEMFMSINLDKDRQKALSRLAKRVLEKPVEERRRLAESLCKPKLKIFVKKGADQELELYEITRRLVINMLSSSEENLKSMAQALDNILNTQ